MGSELPELSHTALLKCCKLCREPEEANKRFLICGHPLCMYKYYHVRCLSPEQMAAEVQFGNPCWYCPSCLCRCCRLDMDDENIMLCDDCDEGYHVYCASPRVSKVPKGRWVCQSCLDAREKEERMLMLFRKDYDDVVLKSSKYYGLNLLLKAAMKLTRDEKVATTAK